MNPTQATRETERKDYENKWLQPYLGALHDWADLACVQRLLGRAGKVFVLWRFDESLRPQELAALTVVSFTLNQNGPQMLLNSQGLAVDITHKPKQIVPGVYAWIPAFFDTRFAPARYDDPATGSRRLTWRFCVRMAGSANRKDKHKPGQVFLTEASEFANLQSVA